MLESIRFPCPGEPEGVKKQHALSELGSENPEKAKFCEECGTPFVRICPSCGQQARSTAKFCPECGMALKTEGKPPPAKSRSRKGAQRPKRATQSARQAAPAASRPASPEAERRQLTVMFCDLVGSTPLAEKLDPEELRKVILAYQEASAQVIRRFDGYLARYIGDGLLVYFGYPQAHEDDAQRALRAGLGIVAALPELNRRLQQTFTVLQDFPLQVRLGIHKSPAPNPQPLTPKQKPKHVFSKPSKLVADNKPSR